MVVNLRWLSLAVPPAAAAAIVAGLILFARVSAQVGEPPELYIADVWVALAFPVVGTWLMQREVHMRVAKVLLANSTLAIVALGSSWVTYDALDGELHAFGAAMGWLSGWLWTPYLLLASLVPVLHVDSHLRGRWTRPAALTTLAVVAVTTLAAAFAPGPVAATTEAVNPLGVKGADWLRTMTGGGTAVTFLVLTPACIAASALHLRRHRPANDVDRGVVVAAAVVYAAGLLTDGLSYPWNDVAMAAALSLLPLAVVVAVRETRLRRDHMRLHRAREEERQRLRRELHDGLGPELAGIRLRLAAASADAAAALRADLDEATERLATVAGDVRRLVDGLRPVALEEVSLAEAIRSRCDLLSDATSAVTCTVCDLPHHSAAVELAAYQIASEALTNAVRHARATQIDVMLAGTADGLTLEVRDDGRGGAISTGGGVGIDSMRARAADVGGTCTVSSTSAGTQVRAVLPGDPSA